MEQYAEARGFPLEGLDNHAILNVIIGIRMLTKRPSDKQFSRAFQYYLDFDDFLPSLKAADPPPLAEIQAAQDKEFLDSLGEERLEIKCRHEDCERGAVPMSIFCRSHHLDSIRNAKTFFVNSA